MTFGILASSYPAAVGYSDAVLADSPLAYWRLGESSGRPQDSSGNGYHLTYDPGAPPTYGATGLIAGDSDTAMDFDGVNDRLVWLDDAAWDVSSISIEAWFNCDSVPTTGNQQHVVDRWVSDTGRRSWFTLLNNPSGSALLQALFRVGSTTLSLASSTTISSNTTYHYCATYDSTSGDYALYLNGSLEDSGNHSGGGALESTAEYICVGCERVVAGTYQDFFDGVIDEVAIYDYALSSTRVAAHYSAGT